MPVSNGDITTPISLTNISTAIGLGSYDLGTLCQSSNINKWSRYKPISFSSNTELTESNLSSSNFGLTAVEIPEIVNNQNWGNQNLGTCFATDGTFITGSKTWSYQKPSGGSGSPFRISDFTNATYRSDTGYRHLARCPIKDVTDINIYTTQLSSTSIMWSPSFRYGSSSSECVVAGGSTEGITNYDQIGLNELTPYTGYPMNGVNKYRLGLAIEYKLTANGTPQYAICACSGLLGAAGQTPNQMMINFYLSTVTKAFIQQIAGMGKSFKAIPFIGYNLDYVVDGSNTYYKFLAGGKAFALPNGEKYINIIGHNGSTSFSITVNQFGIGYHSDGGDNYFKWATLGGTTNLMKPNTIGNARWARLYNKVTIHNATTSNATITVTPTFAGVAVTDRVWMSEVGYSSSTATNSITVYANSDKTIYIVASEQYAQQPNYGKLINTLNGLAIYTGESSQNYGLGCGLTITASGVSYNFSDTHQDIYRMITNTTSDTSPLS